MLFAYDVGCRVRIPGSSESIFESFDGPWRDHVPYVKRAIAVLWKRGCQANQ